MIHILVSLYLTYISIGIIHLSFLYYIYMFL